MHPKRIALVANTTWNIYNFRLNIIQKLLDAGHEVVVLAPVDEFIYYKEKFPSIQHIAIRKLDRDSINPVKDIRLTFELIDLYREVKPDFIIHYTVKPNIYGAFAAKYLGIPSIAVVTGLGYAFIHNGLVKYTTKRLYKIACKFHQKVIFENYDDKQLFNDLGLVSEEKSTSIKGCGVNTSYYRPRKRKGDTDVLVFTFIGRLLYDKGVVEFIHAAKRIREQYPKTAFWLVGELDQENPSMINKDELLHWIKEDIVIYHGVVNDIRDIVAQSDCVILPSYREGLPRVLMESMAMAKPLIATDTAGCREAVAHEKNGFLVPVKDVRALENAIVRFIRMDPEARKTLGEEGRKMATEMFDARMIADTFYDIIDGIGGSPTQAVP